MAFLAFCTHLIQRGCRTTFSTDKRHRAKHLEIEGLVHQLIFGDFVFDSAISDCWGAVQIRSCRPYGQFSAATYCLSRKCSGIWGFSKTSSDVLDAVWMPRWRQFGRLSAARTSRSRRCLRTWTQMTRGSSLDRNLSRAFRFVTHLENQI